MLTGSQLRRGEFRLQLFIGYQTRFAGAFQKDVGLDEVLVGIAARRVVRHGKRPAEIRGGPLRRQSMKLQDQ